MRIAVLGAGERGKHVFVETPMALTLRDADAMIRVARAHRRILMVAQVMRCVASRIRFREAVDSREMGRPTAVVASRLARPYWKGRGRPFDLYGDPVVELSIHDFDLANWILGRPTAVSCSGVAGRAGAADHTFAWVEYRGGGYALVEACARMPPGFPFTTTFRVHFEDGVLDHAGSFTGGPIPEERFVRSRGGRWEPVRVRGQDPYEEECRHFVRAVHGKADPDILSPTAEREALRVALAARESLRTGRRVPAARSAPRGTRGPRTRTRPRESRGTAGPSRATPRPAGSPPRRSRTGSARCPSSPARRSPGGSGGPGRGAATPSLGPRWRAPGTRRTRR